MADPARVAEACRRLLDALGELERIERLELELMREAVRTVRLAGQALAESRAAASRARKSGDE